MDKLPYPVKNIKSLRLKHHTKVVLSIWQLWLPLSFVVLLSAFNSITVALFDFAVSCHVECLLYVLVTITTTRTNCYLTNTKTIVTKTTTQSTSAADRIVKAIQIVSCAKLHTRTSAAVCAMKQRMRDKDKDGKSEKAGSSSQ